MLGQVRKRFITHFREDLTRKVGQASIRLVVGSWVWQHPVENEKGSKKECK